MGACLRGNLEMKRSGDEAELCFNSYNDAGVFLDSFFDKLGSGIPTISFSIGFGSVNTGYEE